MEVKVGEWVKVRHGKGRYTYEFEGEVIGVSPDGRNATVRCECCGLAQPWGVKEHIERVNRGAEI